MTNWNRERAAAVKVSNPEVARSTAYADTQTGEQALPARIIGRTSQHSTSKPLKKPSTLSAPEWLRLIEAILERLLDHGDSVEICAKDLGLFAEYVSRSAASPESVAEQLALLENSKTYRRFRSTKGSNFRVPQPPREHAVRELVFEMANRLTEVALRKPELTRTGTYFYNHRVYTDNMMVMIRDEQAPAFRNWLSLVRELKLDIRVRGFEVNGEPTDPAIIKEKLRLLDLPVNTQIYWRHARNKACLRTRTHVGIDVVSRVARGNNIEELSSEAFRYVMAHAAIAQIWLLSDTVSRKRCSRGSEEGDSQLPLAF